MTPERIGDEVTGSPATADGSAPGDELQPADRTGFGRRSFVKAAGLLGAASALAGCTAGTPTFGEQAPDVETGTLSLSPGGGFVGDVLTIEAEELPAGRRVDLVWHTVDGRWETSGDADVLGPRYTEREVAVATVRVAGDGTLTHDWTVPEDYGGRHVVEARTRDGETLATDTYYLTRHFELDRTTAAIGEEFVVTGYGLGWEQYMGTWEIVWDNGFTGVVTAVSTRGTARAKVRATGPPGTHLLQVWKGFRGMPFLNQAQGSFPYKEQKWLVTVTEPARESFEPWADPADLPAERPRFQFVSGPAIEENPATLELSETSGPAGATVTVTGRSFPADTDVELVFPHIVGNEYGESHQENLVLATIRTDGGGDFRTSLDLPSGHGGTNVILATVDDEPLARTGYVVQPSIGGISQTEGPVGTEFVVSVSGQGHRHWDNTYAAVYDNHYLGYACGFSAGGDVEIPITATGEPGLHTIDLYPSVYAGLDRTPDIYQRPQLTYLDDHPVRTLPALHFTFRVTEP